METAEQVVEYRPVDVKTVRAFANKKCKCCYGAGKVTEVLGGGPAANSPRRERTCACALQRFLDTAMAKELLFVKVKGRPADDNQEE